MQRVGHQRDTGWLLEALAVVADASATGALGRRERGRHRSHDPPCPSLPLRIRGTHAAADGAQSITLSLHSILDIRVLISILRDLGTESGGLLAGAPLFACPGGASRRDSPHPRSSAGCAGRAPRAADDVTADPRASERPPPTPPRLRGVRARPPRVSAACGPVTAAGGVRASVSPRPHPVRGAHPPVGGGEARLFFRSPRSSSVAPWRRRRSGAASGGTPS